MDETSHKFETQWELKAGAQTPPKSGLKWSFLVTGMSHVAQGAVPIATSPGCLAQIATVAVFMFSSLSMEL